MGINLNMGFTQILKYAGRGGEFKQKNILMLGKQDVNFRCGKLKEVLSRRGFQYRKNIVDIDDIDNSNKKIDSYDLFKILGFEEVHALDISEYEGADIIMDLAIESIEDKYRNRFDFIYDGGVLEHIFNAPQAIINISQMLKIGGRVIHDIPVAGWVDHGFYSFSPTFLIDYYTNNGFFINDIYMVGYDYKNLKVINVVSPDVRYNDADEWVRTYAEGMNVLLICDATKVANVEKYDNRFTQYSYKCLFESIPRNYERYSYQYRINRVKEICAGKSNDKIAIYGSGKTVSKMLHDLSGYEKNIVGIYDRNIQSGSFVQFDMISMQVLDIKKVHDDGVKYIVCGSEKQDVIDIIRERIANLKAEGVKII